MRSARFRLDAAPRVAGLLLTLLSPCISLHAESPAETQAWETAYNEKVLPILKDRCADCHDGDDAEGGFDLGKFATGNLVSANAGVWNDVGKRLRLNEMPPEGSPGLNDEQKSILHHWIDSKPQQDLCSKLATDETKSWYRGYVMSRRLTRTEYVNAVEDLVGVPVADPSQIPSDGSGGEGFDTAGDSLFTSAIHIEQYLAVASTIIDEVLASTSDEGERSDRLRSAYKKIMVAEPSKELPERMAATKIVTMFAHRAWRRPIGDDEAERLLTLFDSARERGADFISATGDALKAVLISPHFLFVVETETPEGGVQRLTAHQLATRMALFLWSSIPDEELLHAADEGLLDTDDQVIAQTRRMLADPRSRALGENFGLQWLGLAGFLTSVHPDAEVYPEFNEKLADDLREEAVRMVWSIFRDDRSILDLIDCESAEINGTLASHYKLDLNADADWQRIRLNDRRRGGVISLGAVLMTASYPRRTSPVLRGRWVLEELLGGNVPPPPPNVPALDEVVAEKAMTQRERLEVHRKNPTCAACHNRMDPLGFGLENFDGLGRWRDRDGSLEIDSSGTLPSGETFRGPEELKQVLMRRSGEFEQHLVKKLIGFALGRDLNEFDGCVINDCIKGLNSNEHRSSVIIETIVTSFPFQHRFFKAAVDVSSDRGTVQETP